MSGAKRRKKETDADLMARARSLYHSIHVEECFGTGDLGMYEVTLRKLEQRGYRVITTVAFSKEK